MKFHIIAFFSGFILDLILGDPYWLFHPIRLIGSIISGFEKKLLNYRSKEAAETDRDTAKELRRGTILVLLVIIITAITVIVILLGAYTIHPYLGLVIETIMTYQILATKCLKVESMKVYKSLETEDIEASRKAVSMIVGRDTNVLDDEGVTKAAIETVAENTSDGIIAPMIYTALGGPILGFVYKAVNTMDSMLGYKNDRYLYFGRVAARIDDVANYIPARITGIIFVVSAFVLRLNTTNSWKMLRRDASKHPSPNGGWAEASVAGALEIRLGGYNFYFGRETFRAYMGEPLQEMGPQHIMTCIQMMYTATILFLLLAHVVIQLWDNFCMPFLG